MAPVVLPGSGGVGVGAGPVAPNYPAIFHRKLVYTPTTMTKYLVIIGVFAVVLFATDASSRQHSRKLNASSVNLEQIAAKNQALREAAARHLYGDGNPEHIRALADQLDPEYLSLYKETVTRNNQ